MKLATVTHDVNGIRINIDGVVHHWANQSWLAEAHAQSLVKCEQLEAKLKDISVILDLKLIEPDELRERIEKRMGEL